MNSGIEHARPCPKSVCPPEAAEKRSPSADSRMRESRSPHALSAMHRLLELQSLRRRDEDSRLERSLRAFEQGLGATQRALADVLERTENDSHSFLESSAQSGREEGVDASQKLVERKQEEGSHYEECTCEERLEKGLSQECSDEFAKVIRERNEAKRQLEESLLEVERLRRELDNEKRLGMHRQTTLPREADMQNQEEPASKKDLPKCEHELRACASKAEGAQQASQSLRNLEIFGSKGCTSIEGVKANLDNAKQRSQMLEAEVIPPKAELREAADKAKGPLSDMGLKSAIGVSEGEQGRSEVAGKESFLAGAEVLPQLLVEKNSEANRTAKAPQGPASSELEHKNGVERLSEEELSGQNRAREAQEEEGKQHSLNVDTSLILTQDKVDVIREQQSVQISEGNSSPVKADVTTGQKQGRLGESKSRPLSPKGSMAPILEEEEEPAVITKQEDLKRQLASLVRESVIERLREGAKRGEDLDSELSAGVIADMIGDIRGKFPALKDLLELARGKGEP